MPRIIRSNKRTTARYRQWRQETEARSNSLDPANLKIEESRQRVDNEGASRPEMILRTL